MAITIDRTTKIIFVPQSDLVDLGGGVYQLNLTWFWGQLKDIEDNEGMPYEDTVANFAPVNVGGVVLSRVVIIVNGYRVEFEDGQYAVNLTGANTNLQDVAVVNQVSIRPSNSAGLQDLSTMLIASYGGVVTVDQANGQAGTVIPLGTRGLPVNNFADALKIAQENSIPGISIIGNATLSSNDFSEGFTFYGDSQVVSTLTINPGANINNCTFENMTVTGTMDGDNTFRQCRIMDINYVNGFIVECALEGTITLGGGAQCSILDCWSNIAGGGADQHPHVDMGGSGNSLALRNYSGGLGLENWDGVGAASLDFSSGRLVVQDTITGGTITVRGIAEVEDQTLGGVTISDMTVNKGLDNLATMTEQDKIIEIWKLLGLDPNNIQTISDTQITIDGITINITRNEQAGTTTLDRQ